MLDMEGVGGSGASAYLEVRSDSGSLCEIGVKACGAKAKTWCTASDANGEVGVVWRRGSNATHPVVARLVNANGTLAAIATRRDTSLEGFAITGAVPPQKYQLLVAGAGRLWE